MSREIKFRIWDPYNGEMTNTSHVKTVSNVLLKWELLCDGDNNPSLMQYTGLKDKNGVDIYEGDLLDVDFGNIHNPVGTHKAVEVYFNDDYLEWSVRGGNIITRMVSSLIGYVNPVYKVVGNIYQHQELLK